mgnify:CR=1 FL=1
MERNLKIYRKKQKYGIIESINEDYVQYLISSKIYDNIYIVDIIDENRYDNTYCFNEPLKHMGMFNGILTGNCAEIVEYSDNKEYAVCTLASIALPMFVENKVFNFDKLIEVTNVVTRNLNKIIDVTYYPVPETEYSNKKNRPVGVGIQGLSDVYATMCIAFDSNEARELNKQIFETLYYGAMVASHALAVETAPYSTFAGSPISKGQFQFDLWNVKPSDRYDWDTLRANIMRDGVANSLLIALMPTASTSQILGNNECIEPITSNIYSRRTIAGEFVLPNKYLMNDLIKLGLWNEQIKNNIIANKGSIQHLTNIPEHIRNKYKIVWEIPMKHVIDMSADRGAFICQSQSLNLWVEDPTYNTLTSMHFYSWKQGLKTGIYYLRRKAKHQAQQFTIEPEQLQEKDDKDEICEMCSA